MTHRYGRIPKTRFAATLRGVTTYQSGTPTVPGGSKVPRPKPAPGTKVPMPSPPPHPMSPAQLGYCYLRAKHALIAKGRPAIFVKYVGQKNGKAVVFIPGHGQFVVPFCKKKKRRPKRRRRYSATRATTSPKPRGWGGCDWMNIDGKWVRICPQPKK